MRRLALFCCGFAAATILSVYLLSRWSIVAGLAAAGCSVAFAAIYFAAKKRGKKFVPVFLFVSLGITAGFASFALYRSQTTAPISRVNFYENTYILAEAQSVVKYDSYTAVNAKILDIDAYNKKDLKGLKIRINLYDEAKNTLRVGDVFYLSAKPQSTTMSMQANGIFLKDSTGYPPTVVDNRGIKYLPRIINGKIADTIDKIFSPDTKGFAKALMLGDKVELYAEKNEYKDLQRSGLSHAVAVSGLHVTMTAGALIYILGKSRKSSIICIIFVWLFVLVTGSSPSAVRAGIMLTATVAAPIFKREGDSITSLMFALTLILLNNPYSIAGTGLQFSFAATAGLVLLYKPISENLSDKILLRGVMSIIASSLAVFIFTTPLSVLHFGSINPYSIISNILCLWAVTLAFTTGYIAAIVGFLFLPAGKLIAMAPEVLIEYIQSVCGRISRLPGAVLHYNSLFGIAVILLIYVVILYLFVPGKNRRKQLRIPAVLMIFVLICLSFTSFYLTKTKYTKAPGYFTAVDVGQGQCLAFYCGDKTLIIDCGTGDNTIDAADRCDGALSAAFRSGIDVLICTHFDSDHVNYIKDLMKYSLVNIIMLPNNTDENDIYREDIISCANEYGVEIYDITSDFSTNLDGGNGYIMNLDVTAPQGRVDNDGSLLIKVTVGDSSVLVTGDAPEYVEQELVKAKGESLKDVDILVAGHHGSRYSTGTDLLNATQPKIAVISVGENKYGHPSNDVIERLTNAGANVYRTDQCGNIEIELR